MRNLIIVGNGFDLAHGLETNYSNFIKDIRNNMSKYEIPYDHKNYLLSSLLRNENKLWSDIEAAYYDILTNFNDKRYLLSKYSSIELYHSVEDLNKDFKKIKIWLTDYLIHIQKKFTPCENYRNFFNEFKSKDTLVINFNYTDTVKGYLEKTDIKIIHIHGELEKEENPIIFGFAANNKDSKKLLIENDNHYVENIKKFNYLYTTNEEQLKEHLNSDEYNVFILGHSCGISDGLILSNIFNSGKIHQIIPFYFKNRNGYFNTMVNIDRIIDDYSKGIEQPKVFNNLFSYPKSHPMPQKEFDAELVNFLRNILNEELPLEKKKKQKRIY